MTKFIITRHGQTEWNVEKRMQGQANSPLTELGRKQADALRQRLSDTEFDAVYCSSLQRAVDTADIICKGRKQDIVHLDSLMEIAIGSWSGMLLSEVDEAYPEQSNNFWKNPEAYIPMPGGETYLQLRERAGKALLEMAKKHKNQTVLVVSHGFVLKLLYNIFRYQPLADIASNHPHPKSCCYCEVEWTDAVWHINSWNDTTHYELITDQQK